MNTKQIAHAINVHLKRFEEDPAIIGLAFAGAIYGLYWIWNNIIVRWM